MGMDGLFCQCNRSLMDHSIMSIMLIMSCYTGFFNVRRGWQSLNTGPRFYLLLIRVGCEFLHPAQPTDTPSSRRSSRSHFYTPGSIYLIDDVKRSPEVLGRLLCLQFSSLLRWHQNVFNCLCLRRMQLLLCTKQD